jgi:hypothetical protein
MIYAIILVASILVQIGLSAHIPHRARPSRLATVPCFYPQTSAAVIDCSNAPNSGTSSIPHIHQSKMSRRSITETLNFRFGRDKDYYELNPERATDHLYDIQDGKAVGHEIVKEKTEHLMAQICQSVERARKDTEQNCA